MVSEMTNLMAATRAYEANATVLESLKAMAMRALSIGRA
ncbi:MAG: flagellar basal body rod C-terminal domain-containing protein [Thermomicrobium sp.]|nr:flagellar basal body rod C-terminal domain-containing protein [Thermomicrobium sp.]